MFIFCLINAIDHLVMTSSVRWYGDMLKMMGWLCLEKSIGTLV